MEQTPDSGSDRTGDAPEAAQPAAGPGPGTAAAGVPSGAAPSGATDAGQVPEDARDDLVPAGGGPQGDGSLERAVPGRPPGSGTASPVPAPGTAPGVTSPGVRAAQGPSAADGIHEGDKDADSDATVTSPGAWTAAAAPGKPDGEVDTRSR
jgi:hypothetical protein